MKIAMVSNYFASHRGGIEIVAEQLYLAFAREDLEVRWLASSSSMPPGRSGKSSAVPFATFNFAEKRTGIPFPIPNFRSIRTIFREVRQSDIVLIHDCLYLHSLVAFLSAAICQKPVVIVQHIGFIPYRSPILNMMMRLAIAWLAKPMLKKADQTVFISSAVRDSFRNLRFRSAPEMIFNGVDIDLFRPSADSEEPSHIRRSFGLPADRKIVLFVGRFVEKKGLVFLKIMSEVRRNWIWVFAGWGPLDPSDWNAPNVRVLTDLPRASVAALYRACDVLVLPSYGEGFPLVIQEALASGLPVVCSGESLGADSAMEGVVGSAPVDPENPGGTAAGFIGELDGLLASAGADAQRLRRFAETQYSWQRACRRYLEIFRRLCPQLSSQAVGAVSKNVRICR